jgi:hypothetical protein
MAIKPCSSFEDYFTQVIREPFERWAELESTYHIAAQNCPDLMERAYRDARQAVSEQAERAEADQKEGRGLAEPEIGAGKPGPGRGKKTDDIVSRLSHGTHGNPLVSGTRRSRA